MKLLWIAVALAVCACTHVPETVSLRRDCDGDADCVLVEAPVCHGTMAIRSGQEKEWGDFRSAAEASEKKPVCNGREHPPSFYSAHCEQGFCRAWARPVLP